MCSICNYVVFILFISLFNFSNGLSKHPINIIVSFDGFFYKYYFKNITPTLEQLKEKGASVKYMTNAFPTKTFPNHFTIVTGQYVEEHGVLDSGTLFDYELNKSISYSEELFNYKKSIEPIWILNEKAGDERHSGVMMWLGGEFKYGGKSATFQQPLNATISFKERVDKIIEWIFHPITPVNLVLMYFEEPDLSGHIYGSNSIELETQLKNCDDVINYLLYKLNSSNVTNYNLIILSDHGMSTVKYENIINLDTIVNKNTYDYYGTSPVLLVYPRLGQYDNVLNSFMKAVKDNSHFRVFTKDSIPVKWHYKNNSRVPPLLLVANVGYVFSDIHKTLSYFERTYKIQYGPGSQFGVHGYEPDEDLMHPIFTAYGPAFKSNFTTDNLNNIDLYSLFAKLLDIEVPPNSQNGSISNVNCLFEDNSQRSSIFFNKWIFLGGCGVTVVSVVGWIIMKRTTKTYQMTI